MANGNGHGRETDAPPPVHVAIVMDGSGRWAAARGLTRSTGHRAGRLAVRRTVEAALERGIGVLTLFAFSTENWDRPALEVAELMRTFEDFFVADAPPLAASGARLQATGRRDRLPASLRAAIEQTEASSDGATLLHVRLAIDYSGREAILEAARRFDDGSAEDFSRLLAPTGGDAAPVPDIDLLIRTGGELRLSNCPLWEIAYAELYFTPCLWPDFGAAELDAALEEFGTRHRRFGRIPAMAS
jgi:undecaprenyl diphosphate synthase